MNQLTLKNPADYYSIALISNSGLTAFSNKMIGRPAMSAKPETLELGKLTHLAVYQPEDLPEEVPAAAYRIAAAAVKCPVLKWFLRQPDKVIEATYYSMWNGGVPVKIRPDLHTAEYGHDLKTTACTNRQDFIAKCLEYGYFRQAVFYQEVAGLRNFFFTGVCKTNGQVFTLDCREFPTEMREAGLQLDFLISEYVEHHPGYIREARKLFVETNH